MSELLKKNGNQDEPVIVLKKRGRKPKNKAIENKDKELSVNSEEEQIIAHLPISLEDIVNVSNDENNSDSNDNFFIKKEDVNKYEKTLNNDEKNKTSKIKQVNIDLNEEQMLKQINQKIQETEKIFMHSKNINNVNKVNVHNIKFKPESKCLWCKNSFTTIPSVELPEDYFNNTFFCIGNFCSWNCAKTYNIDLNDSSTWKRESLLNLMYYKTYGEFKEITPAPSWLLLEEFGGNIKIEAFRNLFIFNNKDYLLLHPPLITRQLQIEESYKKSNNQNMALNKLENIYDNNELVIKRNKPIESNSLNLEKTMGLKRKNTPFRKVDASL